MRDTLRDVTTITVDRNEQGDTLRIAAITDRYRGHDANRFAEVGGALLRVGEEFNVLGFTLMVYDLLFNGKTKEILVKHLLYQLYFVFLHPKTCLNYEEGWT